MANSRRGPGRPQEYTHVLVATFNRAADRSAARDRLRKLTEKHPHREKQSNRRGMAFEIKGYAVGSKIAQKARSIPGVRARIQRIVRVTAVANSGGSYTAAAACESAAPAPTPESPATV